MWKKRLSSGPQPFWHRALVFLATDFPCTRVGGSFRMIQVYYIYCALYFYCYYISSMSDYQEQQISEVRDPCTGAAQSGGQHGQRLGGWAVAWSTEAMGLVQCLALE